MSTVVQCSELPSYANDLVNDVAKREGFTTYTITSEAGSKHGDGFQGIMIRFAIEGERITSDGVKKPDRISLLCKMPPHEKARREMSKTAVTFTNEIHSYEVLLPAIEQFQREKGIVTADGFYQFPKCYGTYADPANGDFALVLEDLKVVGFEMWNKLKPIDLTHARLVVRELGKLHAVSFALRDQRPELFARQFQTRKAEIMLNLMDNEMFKKFFESEVEKGMKTVSDNAVLTEKMQKIKTDFFAIVAECLADGAAEPFGVLCHGDYWNNNMMYRYGRGKVPVEACLIDWQITQFCSPAIDISYFLYSSTEQNLRHKHYEEVLRAYYDSLAETLHRLGSDADKLFRWEDLLEQMQKFARYGFVLAFMLLHIVSAKPEDIPDMDQMARDMAANPNIDLSNSFMTHVNPLFDRRVKGVIEHFFEMGYDL